MSEPQFNQYAFGLACTVGWTELVQAMRKDGHTVNDKSGPNTRAWIENIVRDTFIAQAAAHLVPQRAEAAALLQRLGYRWNGSMWNAPRPQPTLRDQLQQQCSDWGAYWRAPDAHGVELTPEQAYELLRRALGVEVNIAGVEEKPNFHGLAIVEDSSLPPDMMLVDAGGSAPPVLVSVDDVHPERVTSEHWIAIGRAQALAEFAEQRANTRRELLNKPVMWSVLRIGNHGAAWDAPNTHRAFTYKHQPSNVDASRLGNALATVANATYGDSIDRGLSLLKALEESGFGVFQIEPSPLPIDQHGQEAVAEYQYRKPEAHDDSWHRMTQEEYEASLATGHCCGIASWTKNFELRKLYTIQNPAIDIGDGT